MTFKKTILLALFIIFIRACYSPAEKDKADFPEIFIYPGCENYKTPDMRNWCFKQKITVDLKNIITNSPETSEFRKMLPADTIYFYISPASEGKLKLDSISPKAIPDYEKAFHIAENWIEQLPRLQTNNKLQGLSWKIPLIFKSREN